MICTLKARRAENGWSQAQLQRASGVPQTTISAIERGVMIPTVTVAYALAKAIGCTIDELFDQERK